MSRTHILFVMLFSMLLPMTATAGEQPQVAGETQAELDRAEALGKRMFLHDRAAARVTDAVRALGRMDRDSGVQGWVTDEADGNIVVTFAGMRGNGDVLGFHRATVNGDGKLISGVKSFDEPVVLEERLASQFKARQAAISTEFEACTRRYNTVVLANPADADTWSVYLIPATTEPGVVPVGGFHRFRVDAETFEVLDRRPFTKTCIRMTPPENVAALTLTHLLDPVPTEMHVFLMYSSNLPVYLMTGEPRRMWAVESEGIRLIKDYSDE